MRIIIHDGLYNGPWLAQINASWQRKSIIDDSPTNLLPCGYIAGYKSAADMILEQLFPFDPRLDMLVFPVFFLYRQYTELLLKKIYMNGHSESEQAYMIKCCGHDIKKLFAFCKDRIYWIILEMQHNVDKITAEENARRKLNFLEMVFEELASYDQNSFAFRYDYNRDLTDSIPKPLSLDLKKLGDFIDQIDTLFYGEYAM